VKPTYPVIELGDSLIGGNPFRVAEKLEHQVGFLLGFHLKINSMKNILPDFLFAIIKM
jgi:hypothetical protein